jgi:hypothetical protein
MNPNIVIHNVETGEIISREMTDAEVEQLRQSGWGTVPNLIEEAPSIWPEENK